MEKTLRVLSGDDEGSGHSHSHSHVEPKVVKTSGVHPASTSSQGGARARNPERTTAGSKTSEVEPEKRANGPSKLSAYLNLFGDFVHNM